MSPHGGEWRSGAPVTYPNTHDLGFLLQEGDGGMEVGKVRRQCVYVVEIGLAVQEYFSSPVSFRWRCVGSGWLLEGFLLFRMGKVFEMGVCAVRSSYFDRH